MKTLALLLLVPSLALAQGATIGGGSSSSVPETAKLLYANSVEGSNPTAAESTLGACTYTLPANTITGSNQIIRIRGSGYSPNSGTTKTVKIYFGSYVIDTISFTSTGGWWIDTNVARSSSTTWVMTLWSGHSTTNMKTTVTGPGTDPAGMAPTDPIVIRFTGTATTAGYVLCNAMTVELLKL